MEAPNSSINCCLYQSGAPQFPPPVFWNSHFPFLLLGLHYFSFHISILSFPDFWSSLYHIFLSVFFFSLLISLPYVDTPRAAKLLPCLLLASTLYQECPCPHSLPFLIKTCVALLPSLSICIHSETSNTTPFNSLCSSGYPLYPSLLLYKVLLCLLLVPFDYGLAASPRSLFAPTGFLYDCPNPHWELCQIPFNAFLWLTLTLAALRQSISHALSF